MTFPNIWKVNGAVLLKTRTKQESRDIDKLKMFTPFGTENWRSFALKKNSYKTKNRDIDKLESSLAQVLLVVTEPGFL